ncbi:hypothetical protein FB479_101980 [Brevibacillus sp. AG162]|uniref:acyl-CoA dehydrogenase family protein n=1 Tax=Brevibacillus sp. AG162 TaxID=2572910 RepID=UPI001150A6FB|nr:acyl-CoA dehydrogenase family protein [Brevibacillus sp. AG162]TQK75363.1 hypothetical protein FB479_101980 [Brevibacillus sp. AG162]
MNLEFSQGQEAFYASCRAFVDEHITPNANEWDVREETPNEIIRKLAEQGYLGAAVPKEWGGLGLDAMSLGLLHEEIGRGCSSIRSLLTVHGMVCVAITRFGTKEQKETWLPRLASGELVGAFGLTEPFAGSDAKSIRTTAELRGDQYVLNGNKKWITYGQLADLFLIFAQHEGKPTAFLVERHTPGFATYPVSGMLGTRASMIAELTMIDCAIPQANLLGLPGFGITYVATTCLDYGRFTIAWGCVGIGQACIEESVRYTASREQFGVPLRKHQLIQKMITEMVTQVKAARLLCERATRLKGQGDPRSLAEMWTAKYFASTMLPKLTSDAVQMHGAIGCSQASTAQRHYRDCKVMEIIEGSTQMHEMIIADHAYQEFL